MITVDFSARRAKNLVWRGEGELTVVVPNKRYQLPEECVEQSLVVMLNGQVLDRVSDNGFLVLSSTVFELKVPKRSFEVVSAGYLQAN